MACSVREFALSSLLKARTRSIYGGNRHGEAGEAAFLIGVLRTDKEMALRFPPGLAAEKNRDEADYAGGPSKPSHNECYLLPPHPFIPLSDQLLLLDGRRFGI